MPLTPQSIRKTVSIYINGELVLDVRCPKIYFDNSAAMINPTGKFQGSFYTFAYYNEYMSGDNIGKITNYFMKMKAIGNELTNPFIDNNVDDFICKSNQLDEKYYESKKEIIEENWKLALNYVDYEQNIINTVTEIFKHNKLI